MITEEKENLEDNLIAVQNRLKDSLKHLKEMSTPSRIFRDMTVRDLQRALEMTEAMLKELNRKEL